MKSSEGSKVCGALRAAFPVKIFPLPAKVQASTESVQDCGPTCGGLFPCADPSGHSLRTFLRCELEELTGCSLTWKDSGTPAGRSWWVLGLSEHPTEETECGSCAEEYQTPTTQPHRQNSYSSDPSIKRPSLEDQAGWPTPRAEDSEQTGAHAGVPDTLTSAARYFPTPNANDGERGPESVATKRARGSGGVNLAEAAGWATPCQRDWKGDESAPAAHARKSPGLPAMAYATSGQPDQANPNTRGNIRGSLNPAWVAQLMIGRGGEQWLDGVNPR